MPYRRNTELRPEPSARFRRVPEWGRCLVYTAAQPEIFALNPSAWLIAELCAADPEEAARERYAAIAGRRVGAPAARTEFDEGLSQLLEAGILARLAPGETDAA